MENYIRSCLYGEILIPIENNYKSDNISHSQNFHNDIINNPKELSLLKILDNNYKSFRSVIFTNEFLHFYLIIKFEEENINNNNRDIKAKAYSMNINELNNYFENNCSINIQYSKIYEEKSTNNNEAVSVQNKIKEYITFNFEENKDIKYVNNGIIIKKDIFEEKNMIIYEFFSKIKLKEDNNNYENSKIEMNLTITTNIFNSYNNLDINDIQVINYLNINDNKNNNKRKKFTLLNIVKQISVINPLRILNIKQFGCGNNKYLLSIKIENITYKINFLDISLKNSIFLQKKKISDDEFLYYEFPIIINDAYINGDKTTIEDLIFINFLKFEQERKINERYKIDSKKIKFNLINNKFPIIIKPSEIFNLIINIEKQYDYLMLNDNISTNDKDNNKINQLAKLNLTTPICLNILSNKPIYNLIWTFPLKWKDEVNNKLNISFKIDTGENNLDSDIKLYNFFKVHFIISKPHKEKVKFELRFNNSYEEFNLPKNIIEKGNKALEGDGLPDILPEKKLIEIEMKENESSKIVEMRYIPVRTEYIELPPFEIFDCQLNKMYFVFFTNKIYVNP